MERSMSARRSMAWVLIGALAFATATVTASLAQEAYPSRLVKVILPSAPGSTTDILARLIADQLSQKWGKPVIVENIAGAGMSIGATQASRAAPDGYTLFISPPSPVTFMKLLYPDISFDPKEFTPIALLVRVPNALVVRKDFPAANVKELIAYAKANPGKITYASQGAGSTAHLSATLIELLAGVEMVHVPFRGAVPALNAVMAGHVDFFFDTVATAVPQHRAGNARIIAVGSTERASLVPEAPPVAETLPGFRSVTWFAMTGPPGLAPALGEKINQAVAESFSRPEVREKLQRLTLEPMPGSPADAARFFAEETALWGKVIRERNVKAQ
jgi:tripartite-type tricarboxylate transporter receptor subunit TctC